MEAQEKEPAKGIPEDDLAYRPVIRFIGVWDSVDAIGLPIDELTEFLDWLFNFRFYSYDRYPIAGCNYHALSLDDERHTFHPLMWDESLRVSGQKIEQVWFSGVHSNVGGGYAKDEMAYVSLDWMMQKAQGWFKLIANVGGRQQIGVGRDATFTAKYSGPLYFYVNDALCDVCLKGVFAYYRNNQGSAEIKVTKLSKTNAK